MAARLGQRLQLSSYLPIQAGVESTGATEAKLL